MMMIFTQVIIVHKKNYASNVELIRNTMYYIRCVVFYIDVLIFIFLNMKYFITYFEY